MGVGFGQSPIFSAGKVNVTRVEMASSPCANKDWKRARTLNRPTAKAQPSSPKVSAIKNQVEDEICQSCLFNGEIEPKGRFVIDDRLTNGGRGQPNGSSH